MSLWEFDAVVDGYSRANSVDDPNELNAEEFSLLAARVKGRA